MEKEAPVKVDKKVSWAQKLFKNSEDDRKVKIEVQGKVKPEVEARKGWKSVPVEFFISNTDIETSEDEIKEAAKNLAKVETLEIERKTKEGATYGSFRIKVDREDFGKCFSEIVGCKAGK